jgi:hypothetical protein
MIYEELFEWILLRGFQFTQVQRYLGSTLQISFSPEFFYCTFHEANVCVALLNACWRSVRTLS